MERFLNSYQILADKANLKKLFVSYHPHRKKSHRGGRLIFFYLIQTKYYFLFQMWLWNHRNFEKVITLSLSF